MADDLSGILPQEREVEAKGEKFTLRPFGFRHMLKALPHFEALMKYVKAEEVQGELQLRMELDQLLREGGDHLAPLMAMATSRDLAWVDSLDLDEGCHLAAVVLELNADFFAKTRARAAAGGVASSSSASGATSSPN